MNRFFVLITLLFATGMLAQDEGIKVLLDSLYIAEVENKTEKHKVLHAEPLYIDLIRDLGARKGEKEWNVGFGLTDNERYDRYEALVEYEWAPVDRLGVEIEIPFSFYFDQRGNGNTGRPQSRMESLKLAAQYTFLVSEKHNTSLALGYIHEFEMNSFDSYGKGKFLPEMFITRFL